MILQVRACPCAAVSCCIAHIGRKGRSRLAPRAQEVARSGARATRRRDPRSRCGDGTAAARPLAVAAADCLPTANRGNQSSYTTARDTILEKLAVVRHQYKPVPCPARLDIEARLAAQLPVPGRPGSSCCRSPAGRRGSARARSLPRRGSLPTASDDAGTVADRPRSSVCVGDERGAAPDSHRRWPLPC